MKAATERVGKFDKKAVAAALRGSCYTAKDHPGILMDVCFDQHGDIDRESYLVEVRAGKQVVVVATLPPLAKK